MAGKLVCMYADPVIITKRLTLDFSYMMSQLLEENRTSRSSFANKLKGSEAAALEANHNSLRLE